MNTDDLYNEGPVYKLGQKLYYLKDTYDYNHEHQFVEIVECEVIEVELKSYYIFKPGKNEYRVERWYKLSDLNGHRHVGPQARQITKHEFLTLEEAIEARTKKLLAIHEEAKNEYARTEAALQSIERKLFEYGIS